MSEPRYSRAELREMKADFEAKVKEARAAWMSGQAYVIIPFGEYLELTAQRTVTISLVEYERLKKNGAGRRRSR